MSWIGFFKLKMGIRQSSQPARYLWEPLSHDVMQLAVGTRTLYLRQREARGAGKGPTSPAKPAVALTVR